MTSVSMAAEPFDLIILGAGPAGLEAAFTARSFGMRVLVIDEAAQAGGQYYRAPNYSMLDAPRSKEKRDGDRLRGKLADADITTWLNHRIWCIEPGEQYRVACATGIQNRIAQAPQLIVATGAVEKVRPVPGWVTPGVVGLAAASVMVKSYGILPGQRIVLAGAGPLMYDVATRICQLGGELVAMVDAMPLSTWVSQTHRMVRKPKLMAKGMGWMAYIAARRVPVYRRHALAEVYGDGAVTGARIHPIDENWAPRPDRKSVDLECDTVCYGYGLQPGLDMMRLLGGKLVYKESRGGWTVYTDRFMRTSLKRVYAAGDMAGAFGIDLAFIRGRLAAYTAALDARFIDGKRFRLEAMPLKEKIPWAASFGRAVNRLTLPKRGLLEFVRADTTVCRCESLTRADLERAIDEGAHTILALRSATRCGMGACGGRYCISTASSIIRAKTGLEHKDIGVITGRPPLRPVHIRTFTQDFSYDELPRAEVPPL